MQFKERLKPSSRLLLFRIILSIKRDCVQRKKPSQLFKGFLIILFQNIKYLTLEKRFLHALTILAFTKIKKWSRTNILGEFSAYYFRKNVLYLILYQLTKFQCQIYSPSEDIKQYLFLYSCLANWWRQKI